MRYFCQVITDLEAKLGPVLFQLPPNFKKDNAVLAEFLEDVPAFEGDELKDKEVGQRIEELSDELVRFTNALRG